MQSAALSRGGLALNRLRQSHRGTTSVWRRAKPRTRRERGGVRDREIGGRAHVAGPQRNHLSRGPPSVPAAHGVTRPPVVSWSRGSRSDKISRRHWMLRAFGEAALGAATNGVGGGWGPLPRPLPLRALPLRPPRRPRLRAHTAAVGRWDGDGGGASRLVARHGQVGDCKQPGCGGGDQDAGRAVPPGRLCPKSINGRSKRTEGLGGGVRVVVPEPGDPVPARLTAGEQSAWWGGAAVGLLSGVPDRLRNRCDEEPPPRRCAQSPARPA